MSLSLNSETQNFLDLESISKKWQNINSIEKSEKFEKQQENTTQTQNQSLFNSQKEQENIMVPTINQKEKQRNPYPQIIDEDTENFRIKLDHLINIFKNNALSEFMNMKKFLLENQVKTIKNETEKYLNMYENKHNELEHTKIMLAEKINENEILIKRVNNLSGLCGKTKKILRNQRILSNYFSNLKNFKKHKNLKKKFKILSVNFNNKRIETSALSTWKSNITNIKLEKQKNQLTDSFNQETIELTLKFNKEIELITKKLKETETAYNEINISKESMQENLKRAFMRGVCALNFEAMNILTDKKKSENNNEQLILEQTNNLTKKIDDINFNMDNFEKFNSLDINPIDENKSQMEIDFKEEKNDNSDLISNKKKIIFFQGTKIESKDHKWREAPVVGINYVDNLKEKNDILDTNDFFDNKENNKIYKEIINVPKIKENVFVAEKKIEENNGRVVFADPNKIKVQNKIIENFNKTITKDSKKNQILVKNNENLNKIKKKF